MAKQAGDIFIEGTIDDLTFYKMEGKYYVRMKSSLTGKKFWKNKSFERSRQSCKRFSEGNRLASKLYKMIDEEKRIYKLYCFLKKRAIELLKEGRNLVQTEAMLLDYLAEAGLVVVMHEGNTIFKTNAAASLKPISNYRSRNSRCKTAGLLIFLNKDHNAITNQKAKNETVLATPNEALVKTIPITELYLPLVGPYSMPRSKPIAWIRSTGKAL